MWMGSQIKLPRSRILKPEKDVPVFMCVCVYSLSGVDCFATPWTIALQAPLFVGLPRPEYWSELLFPSPGDRPKPKDRTWVSCTSGGFFTTEPPGKPSSLYTPMFMLCTLVIQVSRKKKISLCSYYFNLVFASVCFQRHLSCLWVQISTLWQWITKLNLLSMKNLSLYAHDIPCLKFSMCKMWSRISNSQHPGCMKSNGLTALWLNSLISKI